MSRSRRKTPIGGMAANKSEKMFKRHCHHQARAAERWLIHNEDDPVHFPRKMRDVQSPWNGPKDGKGWFAGMLKYADPQGFWGKYYKKLMRK